MLSDPFPTTGKRPGRNDVNNKNKGTGMFPKNAWYVACTPDEIASKPLGRKICGEKIVFYRGSENKVMAVEDFCPHRGAPLSLGIVENGNLVCGYHGLVMGGWRYRFHAGTTCAWLKVAIKQGHNTRPPASSWTSSPQKQKRPSGISGAWREASNPKMTS